MVQVIAKFDARDELIDAPDDLIYSVAMLSRKDANYDEVFSIDVYYNKGMFQYKFGDSNLTTNPAEAFTAYTQLLTTIEANIKFAKTR